MHHPFITEQLAAEHVSQLRREAEHHQAARLARLTKRDSHHGFTRATQAPQRRPRLLAVLRLRFRSSPAPQADALADAVELGPCPS